jgi:hypothetical protein
MLCVDPIMIGLAPHKHREHGNHHNDECSDPTKNRRFAEAIARRGVIGTEGELANPADDDRSCESDRSAQDDGHTAEATRSPWHGHRRQRELATQRIAGDGIGGDR